MSAQRFTVEQIENTATGEQWHAGYARMQGATGAADIHDRCVAMLRAFALQTRQVEQMREYVESMADYWRSRGKDSEPFSAMVERFKALFPKDGGQ